MIEKKSRRQKLMLETLGNVSSESRAVIEAVLQIVAALKNQPGFDAESFDAEMHARIREVPEDMRVAELIMAAAAALPHKAARGHYGAHHPNV